MARHEEGWKGRSISHEGMREAVRRSTFTMKRAEVRAAIRGLPGRVEVPVRLYAGRKYSHTRLFTVESIETMLDKGIADDVRVVDPVRLANVIAGYSETQPERYHRVQRIDLHPGRPSRQGHPA